MLMKRGSAASPSTDREFICGTDLGQRTDYTAFSVDQVKGHGRETRHEFRALERFRRMDYVLVVERIRSFLEALAPSRRTLVLDITGARPMWDAARAANLPASLIGVSITSGDSARIDGNEIFVPKSTLVGTLAVALSSKRVLVAPAMRNADVLRRELANFESSMSASGRSTFEGGGGGHDDTVLSIAMACYVAESAKRPGPFLWAPAGGSGGGGGFWHGGGW